VEAALRAVVVDDSPTDRELTVAALSDPGPGRPVDVVGQAANGASGVESVRSLQPDLVVLDLRMPVLDGFEALPRLRAVAPRALIVVLSSLPEEQAGPAVRAAGAVGFVRKSISSVLLRQEILIATGLLSVAMGSSLLPRDPRSPAAARRFARELLEQWNAAELWDGAELLISELVTNAVTHADSPADVSVRLLPDRVHVAVTDEALATPAVQPRSDEGESGRGMAIVETVADRWGTFADGGRKTVWFELFRARPGT
jgi:CheY-like chemotaxis protein/anti-sigma regulatory factor (Ser/Thr protein kinase)